MYHAMNASSGSHDLELWMLSSFLHHHSQGACRGLWRCRLSSACGIHLRQFYLNLKGPGDLSWPLPHTHENDTWVHLREVCKIFSVTNTKYLRLWPIYTDIISEILLQSEIFSSKWITLKDNCLHSTFQIFLFKLIKENWTTSLIRGTGDELGLSSVSGCVTDHLLKAQCSRVHHAPAVPVISSLTTSLFSKRLMRIHECTKYQDEYVKIIVHEFE